MGSLIMKKTMVLLMLIFPLNAYSQDWSSCEYDLSKLKKAANSTSYIASDLQRLKSNYENCIQYPDTYDLMNDGCESQRADYEYKLSDLDNEMNGLMRNVKGSLSSCGYQ
jgi:conjugal transfer/entry exclusion protein